MDDRNAAAALKSLASSTGEADHSAGALVTPEMVGLYISYCIALGFMAPPTGKGEKTLPPVSISGSQRQALSEMGGRGAAASMRDPSG